jgi:hypothetical protein
MKKETNDLVSSKRDVFGISGGLWSPNNIIQKTGERAGFFFISSQTIRRDWTRRVYAHAAAAAYRAPILLMMFNRGRPL